MSKLLEQINTSLKTDGSLASFIDLIGGGTPKTTVKEYWNGNIPWLSVVDFNNDYRWVSDAEKKITNEGVKNSSTRILEKDDIIISARGTVGVLAQLSRPMAFNQSCYGIRAKSNIDQGYLFYLLKTSIPNLLQIVHGAVFDTITKDSFEQVNVSIPDLPTQKKIAEILSAYDAKIENNNKIIKNLETTAQTIFNEWFVEFEFPSTGGVPAGRGGAYAGTTSAFSHSSTGGEKRNTQNYYSLPYNPKLRDRAKELRKAGNLAEALLWLQIKNKQILGFDFDRQKIIGNYIVDFYCANIGLVVEIDGSSHNDKYEYDKERDDYLKSFGLTVLHFTDTDVKGNMEAVLKEITGVLEKPPRLSEKPPRPTGTPPQEGNKYKSSGGKMVESEMGEIPEGWEVGKIVDLTTVMNSGGTPSTTNNDYYSGDISWFSTKELQDGFLFDSEKKITKEGLNNSSAKIFPEKTVVMAIYAAPTVGRLGILSKDSCFNQAAVGLVAKENVGYEFVYLLLKFLRNDLNNMANGAAQQNLNVGIVKNYNIRIPADALLEKFKIVIEPTFNLIFLTQKENISLKSQRDQLLAKLI